MKGMCALVLALGLTTMVAAQGEDAVAPCGGVFEDTFDAPATVGFPAPAWQPHALDVPDGLQEQMQTLHVRLTWTNAATGGADFGIAVGGPDGFRYWNQEYQTTLGEHVEERAWDRDAIEQAGWHEQSSLSIGPSVSTGQFAAEGVPYRIEWRATYSAEGDAPCMEGQGAEAPPPTPTWTEGAAPPDAQEPDAEDPLSSYPDSMRRALLLALALAAVVAVVVAAGRLQNPDADKEQDRDDEEGR